MTVGIEYMDKIVSFLHQLELLSNLSIDEIVDISNYFLLKEYSSNTILFDEGDPGNILYIVYKGLVISDCQLPNGTKRTIAEFLPGDFFGEMAIFENAPRSATCKTVNKTKLFTLSGYYEIRIEK